LSAGAPSADVTLDPVHLDGIAGLARYIRRDIDEEDNRDTALTVWESYLDPLYGDDGPLLEPLGEQRRYAAPVDDLGLQAPRFETVHGLDSGTVNPRTFQNGLVIDVAQAAMSATPSDLDLHRARTIVMSVHSNDASVSMSGDWIAGDQGYVRKRVVQVPRVARDADRVVHGLSLYLAESEHALAQAEVVDDCLILDGPLYPKEIANWAEGRPELRDVVAESDLVTEVLSNYTGLVDRFLDRGVPLVGFVKSAASGALLRALRNRERPPPTPWADDLGFFRQVLDGAPDRRLAWTNWFRSRLGADGTFAAGWPGVERAHDPEAYEVCFFVVLDRRTDVAYKVELPRAFADDPDTRRAVRDQVLRELAAERGPPAPVGKADSLARIDRAEKASLVDRLADSLDSDEAPAYDDLRWG
jgi:hypothetical protein